MGYYKIEFTKNARKNLKLLDNSVRLEVIKYIAKLEKVESPRSFGRKLKYSSVGNWRYKVSNYRIVAEIQDDKLVILMIAIGHRSIIYDELNRKFNK